MSKAQVEAVTEEPAYKWFHIKNNTVRRIVLIPTDSHQSGVSLVPGDNYVSTEYLKELEDYSVEGEAKKRGPSGKPLAHVFYPGREVLKELQRSVKIDTGILQNHRGPQITMVGPVDKKGQPGLPLPGDLSSYEEKPARVFVDKCMDLDLLKDWMKSETRPGLRLYVETRYATLLSTKSGVEDEEV